MANYVYPAIALIGGGTGALDAIDGTALADKDMAIVSVQGDKTYFYVLNATSGAAEASPGIIQPDANGGNKRWILTGFTPVPAATGFTIAGGTTSKTLTVADHATVGGAAVNPTLPAFFAFNSVADSDVTGDGTSVTVDFDTEVFDQGSNFAADIFTAPVTGKYRFSTGVYILGLLAAHSVQICTLVTSNRTIWLHKNVFGAGANPLIGNITLGGSVLVDMDAADTASITLNVDGGTLVVDIDGSASPQTWFSGELVC